MADADDFSLFTSIRYDPLLLLEPRDSPNEHAPLYMLPHHRDRLLRAATHFRWPDAVRVLSGSEGLSLLARTAGTALGEPRPDVPRRLKIVVDQGGSVTAEAHPTGPVSRGSLLPLRLPPPESDLDAAEAATAAGAAAAGAAGADGEARTAMAAPRRWLVKVDDRGTMPSAHTHFKTTRRAHYDVARRRQEIGLTSEEEVLLVHETEGTVMEGSITTPYFWRDGRWVTPPVPTGTGDSALVGTGGQDGTTRRWALEMGLAVEQPVRADSLRDGEECWISNGVRGFIAGRVSLGDHRIPE